MQKLINGAKQIQEVMEKHNNLIIGVDVTWNELPKVHIYKPIFKEIIEEMNILPCRIEEVEHLGKIKLQVEHEEVFFFTLVDEHDMEMEFRDWIYEEPNIDEEFVVEETPRGVTTEQVRMKEVGMSLHKDFI